MPTSTNVYRCWWAGAGLTGFEPATLWSSRMTSLVGTYANTLARQGVELGADHVVSALSDAVLPWVQGVVGWAAAPGAGSARSQWPAPRFPASLPCRAAESSFMPTMVTILPLASYLVVIASSVATVEASHTWALVMSITMFFGSPA
jgi:hypothetical protein